MKNTVFHSCLSFLFTHFKMMKTTLLNIKSKNRKKLNMSLIASKNFQKMNIRLISSNSRVLSTVVNLRVRYLKRLKQHSENFLKQLMISHGLFYLQEWGRTPSTNAWNLHTKMELQAILQEERFG